MHEKLSQGFPDQNKDNKKSSIAKTATAMAAGVTGGGYFGGIAYGISSLFANHDTAVRIGIGVGGSFAAAGTGALLSSYSHERADDYRQQGNIKKSRLEVVRASVEAAVGFGAAGAVAGFESGSLSQATIGAIVGLAWGGLGSFLQYRERVRTLPKLIGSLPTSQVGDYTNSITHPEL